MQLFGRRLSPIKRKRWDYDTERDDFDQEEVARAKEDKRKFGITGCFVKAALLIKLKIDCSSLVVQWLRTYLPVQ